MGCLLLSFFCCNRTTPTAKPDALTSNSNCFLVLGVQVLAHLLHVPSVAQAATDILDVSTKAIKQTVTSEVEGTLKCKSKNRDPYILLRVVCVHMVCAPQYSMCMYLYL